MRKRQLLALFFVFALLAAACGDSEGDGGDFTPGPLGAVEVGPGEDIQIRALQAISGAVESLGTDQVRGIQLAIEDFGPIKGHNVSLGTVEDDQCSSEGGTSGGQAIAAQADVIGVIGTTCSGAGVPAAQILNEAGMVLLSGSNTSPSLTSDLEGNANANWQPGYYRTAHNDLFQGRAVAVFAFEELGVTKAAAIHDGDPYTDGLATAFANAFEELGGEITIYTAVAATDTDMVPVLTEVAATSPELVFFPIFQPAGDFIIQQSKDVAGFENVIMFAADGLIGDEFLGLPETEGMYFSGPDLRFGGNKGFTGVAYDDLVARYTEEFGEAPPQVFHAHAYDATMMLLNAIDEVAVEDGDTLFIDRQAVRDALYATEDFPGVTGTLTCDEYGDCGAQVISIIEHLSASDPQASKENVVFSLASP